MMVTRNGYITSVKSNHFLQSVAKQPTERPRKEAGK
jgi:hypothetical protein